MNLFSGLKGKGLKREMPRWVAIEKDISIEHSGYYVFRPRGDGFLSQGDLLEIHQRLATKNKAWDAEIQAFFGKEDAK
jgi:hypothetical protein